MKFRHRDIEDNTLHKKLERVLTRNFWPNHKFDSEEFHIYCTAATYQADLFKPDFIGSRKYKQLVKMSDERLRQYLKNSKRLKRLQTRYNINP